MQDSAETYPFAQSSGNYNYVYCKWWDLWTHYLEMWILELLEQAYFLLTISADFLENI